MKVQYHKFQKKEALAPALIRRLLLSWLTAAAGELLLLPATLRSMTDLKGLAVMSLPRLLIVTGIVFALLEGSARLMDYRAQRWMLPGVFAVLSTAALVSSFTWAFLIVCILIFALLLVYAFCGWSGEAILLPSKQKSVWAASLTAVLAIGFFLLVSIWTVARVYAFVTPTYDFTIFAQMFHSMRTTGLPITTVEREGALSHFAVHVSPIYYLLLPFYMIVPQPAMLQVLQAAVLASSVIPLYLLGRHHGLPPFLRTALCALLLLYPAFSGGSSYDIHENAFLTPLILWLFYGIDRKSIPLTALFAVLTMMVKEDAPVYTAVIALWLILRGVLHKRSSWELRTGMLLLISSLAYFFAVTSYLANSGDGVMTYRYKNFMYDGASSLVTVIKAVLLSPMKAVFECVDKEKLEFIGLTLLPLAGIPLLTRRYERMILLIPYILVNLMSDYQYQHDIFFQYTYGSTACLFYLVAVNLADIRQQKLRFAALTLALGISVSCFGANILPKALQYPRDCKTYAAYYDRIRDVLDAVPEDASVAATTYYTTYLSQRDTLYDVRYGSREHLFSCEYIVLSVTDKYSYKPYAVNGEKGYENFRDLVLSNGYEKIAEYEGRLEIYHKQTN
ncbi:MAG: DUF2079 domain-containing protein [Oscillospiraceae bacterium]|nr:DUF2079 domain-containing protein [Oscillospiraceae bacterium]